MTKKEMFEEIKTVALENGRNDLVDFAEKEIALLNKRNSKDSKAKQAKAEEREQLGEQVIEILTNSEPLTTMEIATQLGISPQKATAVLKPLKDSGKVTVEKVKGKNLYSLA